MLGKWFKRCLVVVAGCLLVGTLAFGKDVIGYVRSSVKWTQEGVKNSVPIEFELRRAKDMIEEILPEIHANIQMIAQEEVEIASLKKETSDSEKAFTEEKGRIEKLRNALKGEKQRYTINSRRYSRHELTKELTHRFERFKEAELILESKRRLLTTRERSLDSAMELLEKTKSQKRLLASKIEALEGKHRLIKASAIGTGVTIDKSKIAKTEKLINNIKKRLDVAERVLSHESKFVQTIDVDEISEEELVEQIDEYFSGESQDADETELNILDDEQL